MEKSRQSFLVGVVALGLPVRAAAQGFPGGLGEAFGPRFGARPNLADLRLRRPLRGAGVLERVRHWNEVAIDASGLDHTPGAPGGRVFGQQLGPGRASRAMAIVHTAIFDAINAVLGGYQSYTGLRPAPLGTSVEAAIAVAAHDTLVALFSAQEDDLDEVLAVDLRIIPEGRAKTLGIELGQAAAAAILARRGFPATGRASGGRTRSASIRSRWARTGARSSRSCWSRASNSVFRRAFVRLRG